MQIVHCIIVGVEANLMALPNSHHLQSRVNQLYDHLYANSSVRTPAGIAAEVGKVLHCGMYLEEIEHKRPAFRFTKTELRSVLAQDGPLCALFAAEARRNFKRMNECWGLYPGRKTVILLSDNDLAYTLAKLDDVFLSDPTRDVFGDVVEIIRSNWVKRIGGQFFTDQHVTSLAMSLLQFDPRKGDDLVDLCAGTGGFLLAAINHVRSLLEAACPGKSVEEELTKLSISSIKGLEVDAGVAELGNASITTRLGSLPSAIVLAGDSLRIPKEGLGEIGYDRHLCAASNPPFGASITIKDPVVLSQFDLALPKQVPSDLFSFATPKRVARPPDVLFLEQNLKLLKPGKGRLAIVLPYQILSGPQTLFVREWLFRHAKILAVVDLPSETFQPHTGTKTSLLLIQRRLKPLESAQADFDGEVFMSAPKWIGHDRRGNSIFKKAIDGADSDSILTDFPEVVTAFEAHLAGLPPSVHHDGSFVVPYKALVEDPLLRANALFHKPRGERPAATATPGSQRHEWTTVKVRDVVSRLFYPGRFRRDYVPYEDDAVPFLGGANITELVPTTDKWLRHNDPKLVALTVKEGWILVTRSGSTGIVSSVPKAWDGFAMSEHVIRIVPDPKKLNPYFLMAALRTRYVQEILKRGVFGSVIDEITPEFIGEIEIPIPPKAELARLSKAFESAELSRQNAIEGITSTVSHLNEALRVF